MAQPVPEAAHGPVLAPALTTSRAERGLTAKTGPLVASFLRCPSLPVPSLLCAGPGQAGAEGTLVGPTHPGPGILL